MPKYGIHHIVMKKCIDHFDSMGQSGDQDARETAQLLADNLPAAMMGAIGPDIFFWGPDYQVAEIFSRLYTEFSNIKEQYERIIEPIEEIENSVKTEAENVTIGNLPPNTQRIIRAALNEIDRTNGEYGNAVKLAKIYAALGIGISADLSNLNIMLPRFFDFFIPDMHYNKLEVEWYWFDMLHYRHTGEFANNLLKAATSDEEKAFAYGYLSHISTDFTGHAFVNQICGAPYRMNAWRHVTAESFMDTREYNNYYGESINQTILQRLSLPETLSDGIRDQLHKAFTATYSNGLHPLRLPSEIYTKEQIAQSYDTFYTILELMTKTYITPPQEPFTGVMDILADALQNAIPTPAPMPPQTTGGLGCTWEDILSIGQTPRSGQCYNAFFQDLQAWANYTRDLQEWTIETLSALVDATLVCLLALPVSALFAILYGIQLLRYGMYRAARFLLSINGLVYPEPDELGGSIGRNLTTLFQSCASDKTFPSRGFPAKNNLLCPVLAIESPATTPGFYPQNILSTSGIFIGAGSDPIDIRTVREYSLVAEPSGTRSLQSYRKFIGNAVPLTIWMIGNANSNRDEIKEAVFTDWNLDSDRGYGSRTWHGFLTKSDTDNDFSACVEQYLSRDTTVGIGDDCFNFFHSTVSPENNPDLVNAYLLSFISKYAYSSSVYSNMENEYQSRVSKLFRRWGMDSDNAIFINKRDKTADTEVVILPSRDIENPFLIVMFRGSESIVNDPEKGIRDWLLTNFDPIPVNLGNGVKLHKGFWDAFSLVAKDILKGIEQIQRRSSRPYKIWVTGHSLGGALATICGIWLELREHRVEGVYIYASPRCGNKDFADLYSQRLNGRCHRWVNGRGLNRDLVTLVPPSLPTENPPIDSYTHIGIEHVVEETAVHLAPVVFNKKPSPTNIRAHNGDFYSRGIYRQLLREIPDVAFRMPLPGA